MPHSVVNVPSDYFSMAGFEVTTYGRFCVSPEAHLSDDQELDLGNVTIKVLHTPGHTPESICLLVTDKTRGPEPWFLLTGDTLFVGAVGRRIFQAMHARAQQNFTKA